jgi:hypothetical protein
MAKTKLSETNSKPHRVTVPDAGVWDDFFDSPGIDLGERIQPPLQKREALPRLKTKDL